MEATICAGTRKADGLPCVLSARAGSDYCHHHDPERAGVRRTNAQRGGEAGGRGRGAKTKAEQVERIRQDMRSVAGSVLEGKVSSRAGDTIIRALNGELKSIEVHKRLVDDEAFDKRLSELEEEIYG